MTTIKLDADKLLGYVASIGSASEPERIPSKGDAEVGKERHSKMAGGKVGNKLAGGKVGGKPRPTL